MESATRRHHSQPKNVVSNMAFSIMTRCRILFIATVPPPITGQAVACEALHLGLVREGQDVTFINLSKQSFRQSVNSMGRLLEIARILRKVLRYGRRGQLVYLTPEQSVAGNLNYFAIMLCLVSRIRRTYLHMHGGTGMRQILSARHPWLHRINAWLLWKVAGVILLGERLISIYSQFVPIERIHAVKNFAGDERFIDDQVLALKWAEAEKFNVLFLSNHLPGKGYRELVEAIQSMPPAQRAYFGFHFAGGFEDKSSESEFLDLISTLDAVTYHGTVSGESKRRLLHAAQVFCLPTYYPYEGQPISILEAYASCCAVITTDHSGIFDIFTPEVNGWEVQPKSAQSIANVLARALSKFNSIAEMGRLNALLSSVEYRRTRHLEKLNRCLELNAPVDVIPDT